MFLPPQTPVLVEAAAAPTHQQPHVQRKQHDPIAPSAANPMKPLSVREATARAIEKYLEKVPRRSACALHTRTRRMTAASGFPLQAKKRHGDVGFSGEFTDKRKRAEMGSSAGAADEDKEVCICCGLGCVSAGSEGGQVRVSCESRR